MRGPVVKPVEFKAITVGRIGNPDPAAEIIGLWLVHSSSPETNYPRSELRPGLRIPPARQLQQTNQLPQFLSLQLAQQLSRQAENHRVHLLE